MTDPIVNPLGTDGDAARREEEQRLRVELAIGKARKAEEWFDIFVHIVEHGVKSVVEQHQGNAVELLAPQRGSFAAVRHILKYQGLPLTEEMEWEGPEYIQDAYGFYHGMEWPRGEWIKITWPDRDVVELRGRQAVVMATFLLWWQQFAGLATAQQNMLDGKAAPRRIIDPGSPEWNRYFQAKAQDIAEAAKRGESPS